MWHDETKVMCVRWWTASIKSKLKSTKTNRKNMLQCHCLCTYMITSHSLFTYASSYYKITYCYNVVAKLPRKKQNHESQIFTHSINNYLFVLSREPCCRQRDAVMCVNLKYWGNAQIDENDQKKYVAVSMPLHLHDHLSYTFYLYK